MQFNPDGVQSWITKRDICYNVVMSIKRSLPYGRTPCAVISDAFEFI